MSHATAQAVRAMPPLAHAGPLGRRTRIAAARAAAHARQTDGPPPTPRYSPRRVAARVAGPPPTPGYSTRRRPRPPGRRPRRATAHAALPPAHAEPPPAPARPPGYRPRYAAAHARRATAVG